MDHTSCPTCGMDLTNQNTYNANLHSQTCEQKPKKKKRKVVPKSKDIKLFFGKPPEVDVALSNEDVVDVEPLEQSSENVVKLEGGDSSRKDQVMDIEDVDQSGEGDIVDTEDVS